jgi:hypothetical protein
MQRLVQCATLAYSDHLTVRHFRFQYGSVPLYRERLKWQAEDNARADGHNRQPPASHPGAFSGDLAQDDALSTIMQWLYARMATIQRP